MKPDKSQLFDRERQHFNLARLRKGGHNFEIDIDPELATSYKEGKKIEIRDIMKAEKIFADVKKGMLAPENVMKELFKTDDVLEIAKIILDEGQMQFTAEHRQLVKDRKKKRIINLITRNGIDPKTGTPIPPSRIEAAMEEAKVRIDDFKSADEQVNEILKKLRPLIPISFETKQVELGIETKFASQAHGIIKQIGKIVKEEWSGDNWSGVVEVPAGLIDDLFNKLNSLTHGNVQSKIVKVKQ